jgi:hypothetical protein
MPLMNSRYLVRLTALSLGSLLVVACDPSDSESADNTTTTTTTTAAGGAGGGDGGAGGATTSTGGGGATAHAYSVEYVESAAGLHVGKSQVQIKLMDGEHKPATGLASSIVLEPMMDMGMMAHGAPVPIDAVSESATPGTYDCTLYFPMASVDASNNPAGQWTLGVDVGSAHAGQVDLTVGLAKGTSTTHVMLKNSADTFMSHGSPKMRSYPLFADSLESAGGGDVTFKVFVATIQEGAKVWPPVTVGLELVDETGAEVQLTIQSLKLQASTDGATWTPMNCDATARCGATLKGLSSGVQGSVFVKMAVNDKDYTTDGNAPDAGKGNGFATFKVTP